MFRAADAPPIRVNGRIEEFDGLRGFLALGIFFHHAAVYQQYLRYGIWDFPPSRFYLYLGQLSLAMFFMMTGYLFYSYILKKKGRPNWSKIYFGRVFRLVPVYWLLVLLVLIGVGINTGWRLNVGHFTLAKQIARWSAGGLFLEVPINGYASTSRMTMFVTWTLQYEWVFCLSLLVLAIPARWRWSGIVVPPALLSLAILHEVLAPQSTKPWICAALLLAGMSIAGFRTLTPNLTLRKWQASLAFLVIVVLPVIPSRAVYRPLPVLILGVGFLLIVLGANPFGLLSSRPARRLGNISYGVYLLQGPVLAVAFASHRIRGIELGSPAGHFAVSTVAAIVLVVLATVAHRFIEKPGVELGHWLFSRELVFENPAPMAARRRLTGAVAGD